MTKPWLERIDDAEATGYFTDEDNRRMRSWATCFVNELYRDRNRSDFLLLDKSPTKDKIINLGALAVPVVANNDFKRARQIYAQIAELVKALDNLQDTG